MMSKNKKTIGIDARMYGGNVAAGLGRYVKEVVDRIVEMDDENRYVVFLSKDNFDDFQSEKKNIKKVLVKTRWYTFMEQIVMPFFIFREKINLMFFLHFNVPVFSRTKFVVTIHDLILITHPSKRATTLNGFFYRIKNLAYRFVIRHAVQRSEKVIAVSEFTKKDILENFRTNEDKIKVIYEGVFDKKSAQNNLDNSSFLRYNITQPYLLYVGNAFPHKNLEALIQVFKKISKTRDDLSLVFVGKEDFFYKRLKSEAGDTPKIKFLGFVPDDDLVHVYKNASIYVFPSKYEGFGIPPLEAMREGCPVASSNASCMPEVLGSAASYFDPNNLDEMQKTIEGLIDNQSLKEDLIEKGFIQTKKYSWDDCAKTVLEEVKKYS